MQFKLQINESFWMLPSSFVNKAARELLHLSQTLIPTLLNKEYIVLNHRKKKLYIVNKNTHTFIQIMN